MGCVWRASNFSGWILALGLCASERGTDLRGRQANSGLFLFSHGKGRVRRIFLPHLLKTNGNFAAMRQRLPVKKLGDLGCGGFMLRLTAGAGALPAIRSNNSPGGNIQLQ